MNIGLIGGGAIAHYLLNTCQTDASIHVKSVLVRDIDKYKYLQEKYGTVLFTDLGHFLASDIDIVVEAAGVSAVNEFLPEIIKEKDVIIISIGALANKEFYNEIEGLAKQHDQTVYLPSGAIGGLDLIQNITTAGNVSSVTLETRKPAHTLIDREINESEIIYNGPAIEAIKQFPKNVNVAITLALAGIGLDDTKVTVIADPNVTNNIHTIKANGDFGETILTIKNNPLPENPKTSYLAAMSIVGTLKRLHSAIKIGS